MGVFIWNFSRMIWLLEFWLLADTYRSSVVFAISITLLAANNRAPSWCPLLLLLFVQPPDVVILPSLKTPK